MAQPLTFTAKEQQVNDAWNAHLRTEFSAHSADEAIATMVAPPRANQVPVMIGGDGQEGMNITIRPLTENDLPAAGRIICLAFGTFLGAPEPEKFWTDVDYAHTRRRAVPMAAFGAEIDGTLVGSNFAT